MTPALPTLTVETVSLALAFALVSLFILNRSKHPRAHAVGLIIGASTFVPIVSSPVELVLLFFAASAALSIFVSLKVPIRASASRFVSLAVCLLLYMEVLRLIGGQTSAQDLCIAGAAFLVVALTSKLNRTDLAPLARTLSVFLGFHLVFAIGELAVNFPPIWPMGNGLVDLAYRPNFLLPNLPGRPMTSFAHPIPLATFAAMVGLLNCYVAMQTRRFKFCIVTLMAAVLVALSGTRSAVIAMTVGLAVLLLSHRWSGAALKVNVVAIGGVAVALLALYPSTVLGLIGLGGGFKESNSFQYRISILGSATRILDQPIVHVLFGWGGNRQEVFSRGIVDGAGYGVLFFDNQFVAMAALFGLIGFALFLASFVAVALRGDALAKGMLATFAIMAFGFDFLQYLTPALLFFFALAIAGIGRAESTVTEVGAHEESSRAVGGPGSRPFMPAVSPDRATQRPHGSDRTRPTAN